MKQAVILRHANATPDDKLIETGRQAASTLTETLGKFEVVVSSPTRRTQETAKLLSGTDPRIEPAAGTPKFSADEVAALVERRKDLPLGIAGAIWEKPEYITVARIAGEGMVELIKHLLAELQPDQRALIVSHDGTMVAAEKLLDGSDYGFVDHTYGELKGYTVNEALEISRLK